MGKTIGVLSLKGGVGKTSSVIALGDSIADFGKKVLVVDGNLSSPTLGIHLNILEPQKTLHHILNRTANPNEAIYNFGNFDVLPSTIFPDMKINPFELKNKLKYYKNKYDVIIVDSSPSLDEETLSVMLASDEIILITTPDYPTLSTTIKAIKAAKNRDTPISGLILNKVHNKNFELSIRDIEETSGVPVLAVIPYDINFLKSLSEFTPYTNFKKNSKGSVEYRKLAGVLIGQKYTPFSIRNFFGIPPKRQDINREIFYDNVFG